MYLNLEHLSTEVQEEVQVLLRKHFGDTLLLGGGGAF